MQKSFKLLFLIAVLVVSLVISPVMPASALSLPAQMNKSFNPIQITAGGASVLSVTIYNPNSFPLTAAHYHDLFPAGIVLANPIGLTNTCGISSTVTDNANDPLPGNALAAGGTMFRLDGGTVPAQVGTTPGSCTVSVNVTSITPGNLINTIPVSELVSTGNDGGNVVSVTNTSAASATLQVLAVAAPTLRKSFTPATIIAGQASQLAIVITNTDPTASLTQTTVTDALPANVVLSSPLTTSLTGCGSGTLTDSGGSALAAGSTSVKLNNATVAPNSTCTIRANVTSQTGGTYVNTIPASSIQTQQGVTNAAAATQNLTVQQTVSLIKNFNPATIAAGGTSTLTITLRNPTGSSYTGASVSDTLPGPLLVNGTPTTTCGGTLTTPVSNEISLTGATIPASNNPGTTLGTCTITVPVIAPLNTAAATYTNTIPVGGLTTTQNTSNSLAATAPITVRSATIAKAFNPTTFAAGGTTTLTITISNPTATALTNASISDTLPTPLVIANSPASSSPSCGSPTLTAAAGTAIVSMSGGTVPAGSIATPGTCTITVTVTAPANTSLGTFTNTIPAGPSALNGSLQTDQGVTNAAASNTASATVRSVAVVKAFAPTPPGFITAGGTAALTITLQNPTGSPYHVSTFTDTLPAPLIIVGGSALTSCSGGTPAITAPRTVTLTGGTIPAGTIATPGTCTVTVTVNAPLNASGSYTNTINAGDLKTVEGAQNTGTSTANLTVQPAVTVSKAFSPTSFAPGGQSTLTITLQNNTATNLTNVSIQDVLPATPNTNLTVVSGTAATTCGGTASTTAPRTVSLVGASLLANSSCDITVNVTVPSGSPTTTYNNNIAANALGSTEGATSSSASASVTVDASNPPTLTKTFNPASIVPGANTRLRIQINLPAGAPISGFSITDNLPAGMTISNSSAAALTGCGAGVTFTHITGGTSISLSNASITGGTFCRIDVYVTSSTPGLSTNTIHPTDITGTSRTIAAPVSANLTVSSLSASKSFNVSTIAPNGYAALRISLTNSASTALTSASVTDTLPGTASNGLVVATPNPPTIPAPSTSCGGTVTAIPGSQTISLTGGTVPALGSCTITVYVQGKGAVATYTNTIANANIGAVGNDGATVIHPLQAQPASAQLSLASLGIVIVKGFVPQNVTGGIASTLSVQLTNPNNVPLTGITFTDLMTDAAALPRPFSIYIANPPNFSVGTCGGTITGAPGSNTFTFSGGALAANGASCTLTLSTTMNVDGNLTNLIGAGAVTTTEGATNPQETSASLTNQPGASVSKIFTPNSIVAGGVSSSALTITIKNIGSTPLTGMGLIDNFPASLIVSSPATSCNDSSTGVVAVTGASSSGQKLELTAGSLSANSNCTITATVTGNTTGNYQNTIPISALTDNESITNDVAAVDTLAVTGPASISGTVYNDLNGNGSFDAGEPGLALATVTLYADDGTGHPTGSALGSLTTDSTGAYSFTGLPAGNYVVQETNPTNYGSTGDTSTSVLKDYDLIPVSLASGATSTGNDFFDWQTNGSISGTVYDDLNGNGVFDTGEAGLFNVPVSLYAADGITLITSMNTDSNGAYSFTELPAGNYVVKSSDLFGYVSTDHVVAGKTDNVLPVTLAAGQTSTGNDFFDWLVPGTISGTVYNDLNGNGSFNTGEPGLPVVKIQLFTDNAGNPGSQVGSDISTDSTGAYKFLNIPPGSYWVKETDSTGFTSTGDTALPNDNLIPVVLASGADSTGNDFFDKELNPVIDPPLGYKTLSDTGFPQLEFRLVWINSANATGTPPIHVQVADNIPAGTTYVDSSLMCVHQGSSSTDSGNALAPLNTALSTCAYDSSANSGSGGIQWQGTIAPDPGKDQNNAVNAVIITFRVTVNDGVNQVRNTGTSVTDTNTDSNAPLSFTLSNNFSDVDSTEVTWNRPGTGIGSARSLPGTGFAPNVQTVLPVQPADKAYSSYGDVWLEIPSLGVKMPIVGVPRLDNSWDVSWLANQAGWLESTAFPSWVGNSVLTGHVYMADGQPGPFVNLSKLRWGDQIIAHVYGVRYVYEVRDNRVLSPTDTSVLGHKNDPWMTLLTCKDFDASSNTYAHRVAISAVYINSQVEQGR